MRDNLIALLARWETARQHNQEEFEVDVAGTYEACIFDLKCAIGYQEPVTAETMNPAIPVFDENNHPC